MAAITDLERKIFIRSALIGGAITLLVLICDFGGWLGGLEKWLYDRRASDCQYFRKAPSDRIVHIDIDDGALAAIGQWPWSRADMADMLNEIGRAQPKAVGIDIIYSEPARPEYFKQDDGTFKLINEDDAMAAALSHINVMMPISVQLAPPRSVSTLASASLAEITANLELTPQQLSSKLRTRGFGKESVDAEIERNYLATRRQAMFDRIQQELDQQPLTVEQLQTRLLPTADSSVNSPLRRLLQGQYEHVHSVREVRRFGRYVPANIPNIIATIPNLMPIPAYTDAASGSGFVDVDNFSEPVVRSLPLFVTMNNQAFAQWGLAFGCAIVDADLSKADITRTRITIPSPHGNLIIPVRDQYSRTLGRSAPLIADVPWWGTDSWETMYDWPNYKSNAAHASINMAWDICLARDKIRTNNLAIDQAAEVVLNSGEEKIGLDPAIWNKFKASTTDPEDIAARQKLFDDTKKTLNDLGLLAPPQTSSTQEVKPDERAQLEAIQRAMRVMPLAIQQAHDLEKDRDRLRGVLADKIRGKGVLVGWTATSAVDFVSTPLHARCPGVVVHGAIANALLTGVWWRTAPLWVTGLLTVLLGLFTAAMTGRLSPLRGVIVAIATLMIYFFINGEVMFDFGHWIVGAAGPLVAIGTVWAGCSVMRLITEGLHRIRLDKELAVSQREMELAKNVQQALLPEHPPKIPGIEPFGWTKAADLTGGDCYDLWTLPDGRLGILLADASGHGLAPSVIVSQVRTLVRALSEIETHPNGLIARVNARLAQDLEPARFVTAFLGFLSSSGEVQWASAGHGPMLWCAKEGEEYQSLDASALPLGIMEDFMGDDVPPLQLEVTGQLIVMSDGIFEAPDPTGEQFGVERVIETLQKMRGASPEEITAAIRDAVTKWQAKDRPVDDQTTVIIRRVEAGVTVTVIEGQETMVDETATV